MICEEVETKERMRINEYMYEYQKDRENYKWK